MLVMILTMEILNLAAAGLRLSIDPSKAYMIKYQIAAINNY
jgi:hypothetical protein